MFLLSIMDILGVDEMMALDIWWGWKRRLESWKEKGVVKTRAKGYPEKDTTILQGKIMMICTAIVLTKLSKSRIKGYKRLPSTVSVKQQRHLCS